MYSESRYTTEGTAMKTLKDVKPGDTVLRVPNRPAGSTVTPKKVTVAKVGRTLVHVYSHEADPKYGTDAYRIENGALNGDYGYTKILTQDEYAASEEREILEIRLRIAGIESRRILTNDQLKAILKIVGE